MDQRTWQGDCSGFEIERTSLVSGKRAKLRCKRIGLGVCLNCTAYAASGRDADSDTVSPKEEALLVLRCIAADYASLIERERWVRSVSRVSEFLSIDVNSRSKPWPVAGRERMRDSLRRTLPSASLVDRQLETCQSTWHSPIPNHTTSSLQSPTAPGSEPVARDRSSLSIATLLPCPVQ